MIRDNIRNRLNDDGHVERIEPDRELPGIVAIHLKRYDFALPYCHNKSILDAACGVGYGTAHLAQTAHHVVGIDIDPNAISYAQQRYVVPNISFQVGDVTKTGFIDNQFQVICAFETIEHLPDITLYLHEVTRILDTDGVYIVSTPQATITNHKPHNPYHNIEFSRSDFAILLSRYFEYVEMYGQRRKQSKIHYHVTQLLKKTGLRSRVPRLGKIRDSVNRTLGTSTFDMMSLEDILITKDKIERASELIAVCRRPNKAVSRG